MVQSDDGLLWFGTWDGLNCYDGYSFTTYNMVSPGGTALSTNRLTDIQIGADGDLWCSTYDARLFLFRRKEQTFVDVLAPIEKRLKKQMAVENTYVLPKGIVWFLCQDGRLFRLDMQKFRDGGEGIAEHPMKGKRIYRIHQDADGNEWLLTDQGIEIVGNRSINAPDLIFRHIKERNGHTYLVSEGGELFVFRQQKGDFERLATPGSSEPVTSLKNLGRDTLLLQTPHSLTFYACKSGTASTFHTADVGRAESTINQVHTDKKGICWILLNPHEMLRLNPQTGDSRLYALPPSTFRNRARQSRSLVFNDPHGMLWVIPEHEALCYYDAGTDCFRTYLRNPEDPSSSYVPFIRYSLLDRQGNLWYAPYTGLEKVSFLPHFFTLHTLEKEMDIRSFLNDRQGNLWVGSQNGTLRIYQHGDKRPLYVTPQGKLTTQPSAFPGGAYALLQARNGDIWLGTKEAGLYRLRPSGARHFTVSHYTPEPGNPYSLSANSVYALCEDSRGRIWVGTFGGGLNLVQEHADGQVQFIHRGNVLKGFPLKDARIRCLKESPDSILLVGTTDGLIACRTSFRHPEDIIFRHHRHIGGDRTSLNSNDIMDVFIPSSSGTDRQEACILSFTGGLNFACTDSLMQTRTTFRHFTTQDGLLSNLVHSMTDDGKGHYWVVAENGLTQLDPQTGLTVNYRSDRFGNELKFAETVPLLRGDTLLLGTNLGVLSLRLNELPQDTYTPAIVLTEMRVQGRPLHRDANRIDVLTLSPEQRNISFRFAAVDFVNSSTIQYAYRLRGLEEQWNEVGNTRSASYMNLPAGEYTLEIRSTNSNGVWMDNTRSLRLVVEPKFTETAWAWALYVLLFLLLVGTVGYVLFYIYRLRHRIDMEQQLADIKLRFFTDISHELRTPLTLIAGPVEEVLQSRELSDKDREHLSLVRTNTRRMLRMMNQILDFRKLQNRKMKLIVEEADLIALLRQVMLHFRAMAEAKHIAFTLSSPVDSLTMWLDTDKVEKVFFNLLSNAFKYTPDGKSVSIEVSLSDRTVSIAVADRGIGIDEQHRKMLFHRFENFTHSDMMHPSSGIGLSMAREMVGLHHGQIDVESQVGEGSRFTVTLPLSRSAYEHDEHTEFILNDGTASASPQDSDRGNREAEDNGDDERLTLLVVEDNDELRLFLRNILSADYRVIEATDGKQGLELACEHIPDLLITDVMMPVMNGLEMVSRIKADRTVCHIPIIILSAKSSLDDRIVGLERGIDDYITKPFSATYLKTRIRTLIRRRQELQEFYRARFQPHPEETAVPTDAESTPTAYEPKRPQLESLDDRFMEQVMECIEQNMDNQDFEIETLAEHLFMSRTVFYRKLKSITGMTPVAFVGEMRIKRALQLMENDGLTISQVAYMTGFNSPKYFSKVFKKAVGCTPSEYKEQKKGDDE